MARRVFFSFHYEKDAWRAGQVRNSGYTKSSFEEAGFIDAADWESIKRYGDNAIRQWINSQLDGTSVTVVLIGSETANREWVMYEIQQSAMRGNGLLGIYIHNVKDMLGQISYQGRNPFDLLRFSNGYPFSSYFRTYDWVMNNGYQNFPTWVEQAAYVVGR